VLSCAESICNVSTQRVHTSAKASVCSGSGLKNRDPQSSRRLPKFNRTQFLVQGYICDKIFHKRSAQVFQRHEANCGNNAIFRNVEEYFRKFLDPDPDADDFRNLISSSLSNVHRYICDEIFTKIISAVFR